VVAVSFERFNIHATPFQMTDRYQAALVNSYFNVLVQYGDEFETLGFEQLIEVKVSNTGEPEIQLRNPEFDITRSIKEVLYAYQAGGNLFDSIGSEVEFIGYVSGDELLPELLAEYRQKIAEQLEDVAQDAGGRFSVRFIEPEARGGMVAKQISEEWGFQPMAASLFDDKQFYFYLTLANKQQVVQLPSSDFDADNFRQLLDAGLKRFASGFTKTVALAVPKVNPQMARYNIGGPTFNYLERTITGNYSVSREDLSDGTVDTAADILAVVAPENLSEKELFAIDQFLMRGGSVVLASSPFTSEIAAGRMSMRPRNSGLEPWLAHHGIRIDKTMVLDEQNAAFPAPVTRNVGGMQFQDVQMIDYPFFLDLRPGGLNEEHPITADLPQLTMAWASPITVTSSEQRSVSTLLQSSAQSWVSADTSVMPSIDEQGLSTFRKDGPRQSEQVGVLVQGRFESYFKGKPSPLKEQAKEDTPDADTEQEEKAEPTITSVIERSPDSARIILYASNDFMDDQILGAVVSASGTQYLGPLELFANSLDWALEDGGLLGIRSRAHFNRTLPPMERDAQVLIEYFNYGLAVVFLMILAFIHWLRTRQRRQHYGRVFA